MIMIGENVFVVAMEILHKAVYGIKRPDDEEEFLLLRDLIDGYMLLLATIDATVGKKIREWVLTHREFDEAEAKDLYQLITAPASKYQS